MILLTPFDPTSEVESFIAEVIGVGWPILLAIALGLLGVILATGAVRRVFRAISMMVAGEGGVTMAAGRGTEMYDGSRELTDYGDGRDPWGL